MNDPCEEFADRIVDYVDGELPQDEARVVADHLTACESCRRAVESLNRSLGLAKVLWSDNLGDRQVVPWRESRHIWRYAVAAAILIAASILVATISNHRPQKPLIAFEDVEQQIVRAGAAAELLAATQILARCEGTESIVEEQRRYILSNYADTPAAAVLANNNPF
mgnify:CR=1 FL=1